jgi:hypothetical protein
MFDQLLDWLSRQPAPERAPLSSETIGIGATALCLRWGAYLAVLLDESKPLDPRIASPEISMVAGSEMKRINIEFSSNLARLVRMLQDDEAGCSHLLHLAHQYLPVPRLRFRQCPDSFESLQLLSSHTFWETAGDDMCDRLNRARLTVSQHPYRILANSMTLMSWRNGPVEDLHCGWASGYSLRYRRATDRQSKELMSFTSSRLAVLLSRFRPWAQSPGPDPPWPENIAGIYISPRTRFTSSSWSLTESCSPIRLEPQEATPKPAI